MMIRTFALAILSLSLTACNMSGSGQKGPFKAGSTVTISKLDEQASPIASKTQTTQVFGRKGNFSISNIRWNGWAELNVSGAYFDEFSNAESSESFSLNAITRKDQRFDRANIHLFSHLAAARIKQHVANGKNRKKAWRKTQAEMKALFDLKKVSKNRHRGVEKLSLLKGNGLYRKDNANLLLFTGSFLATGGNAALLQSLTSDFADDALINGAGASAFNAIAIKAGEDGLLASLSQNLVTYGISNPPNTDDMLQLPSWVIDGDETDVTPPVITITGDNPLTVDFNSEYTDQGATATDDVDEVVSVQTISNNVDTSVADGQFEVEYESTDAAGNTSTATRIVNISSAPVDTVPPVITIIGDNPITVAFNSLYNDLGATATDNVDPAVSTSIFSNNVDTSVANGHFEVVYTSTDLAGNSSTATRVVNIGSAPDTIPPVITITGDNPITVAFNSLYNDLGATATDNVDPTVSATIFSNNVDTSVANGHFEVVYTSTDLAGNSSTATRVVNIGDDISTSTNMTGLVSFTDGSAVNGAEIKVYKDSTLQSITANSDSLGGYNINLEHNSFYTIVVTYVGYATQVYTVSTHTISNITQNTVLVEDAPVIIIEDPSLEFTGTGDFGTQVTLGADALANIVGDEVELTMTPLDISTDAALAFVPGGGKAIFSGQASSMAFKPLGLVEFTFINLNTGEETDLALGQTAQITIPLFRDIKNDGSSYVAGDTIPLLYLDEVTGFWKQDGEATVVADASNAHTGLVAVATVSHFTWWSLLYPTNPSLAGNFPTTNFVVDVKLSSDGQKAFIADGTNGVKVLDITNLNAITTLGSFTTAAYGVMASSDESKLFVRNDARLLQVLDISNLATILSLGQTATNISTEMALSSDGTKIILGGLEILDVTNPSSVTSISSIDFSTLPPPSSPSHNPKGLAISGDNNTAYVAGGIDGLVIFDISDTANPIILGNTGGLGDNNIDFALDVTLSSDSNTAYVTDFGLKRLTIFNVADPSNPVLLGWVGVTDKARSVNLSHDGTKAFVTTWESGLQIIDISSPASPVLLAVVDTQGKSLAAAVSADDKFVFVADWDNGLQVINVDNALLTTRSIPPTINIFGLSYTRVGKDELYIDLGATATDDFDASVTVTTAGVAGVDTSTIGLYTVTYTAIDSDGNISIARRTVEVEAPVIIIDPLTSKIWQDDIVVTTNGLNWGGAVNYCSTLSLGGISTWRLPIYNELRDFDQAKVHNYPLNQYWSNSSSGAGFAWFHDYTVGDGGTSNKVNIKGVRCISDP